MLQHRARISRRGSARATKRLLRSAFSYREGTTQLHSDRSAPLLRRSREILGAPQKRDLDLAAKEARNHISGLAAAIRTEATPNMKFTNGCVCTPGLDTTPLGACPNRQLAQDTLCSAFSVAKEFDVDPSKPNIRRITIEPLVPKERYRVAWELHRWRHDL
jgi:hypothetical protein